MSADFTMRADGAPQQGLDSLWRRIIMAAQYASFSYWFLIVHCGSCRAVFPYIEGVNHAQPDYAATCTCKLCRTAGNGRRTKNQYHFTRGWRQTRCHGAK